MTRMVDVVKNNEELQKYYGQFMERVQEEILHYLPEEFKDSKVEIVDVIKNNDEVFNGLRIVNERSNITPNIYLNGFFEQLQTGKSMENILASIAEQYMDYCVDGEFDVTKVMDYEQAKDWIICELRSKEKNVQYLKDKPYMPVEDMAVTYHVFLGETYEGERASVPVTKEIFQNYGIDIKDLHETAMKNTTRLFPPIIQNMWNLLKGYMMPGDMEDEEPELGVGMYVLTNEMNMKGAVGILDSAVMERAAERIGGEFFVIPSSVNEVILIKKEEGMDYHVLEAMVEEVNATEIANSEVLSDHVYKADLKEHCLVRCDQAERKLQEERKKEPETLKSQPTKPKKAPQARGPKL